MNEFDYLSKASKEMDNKEFNEVISSCDNALKINSKLPDAYNFRGKAKYELEEYEAALKDFSNAIDLEPNESDHYYERGWTYTNLDRNEDAILDINKAIELEPDESKFYIARGIFEYDAERYKEAVNSLSKGIMLNPTPSGCVQRGMAYQALELYNLALKDYNAAIELDPSWDSAYYRRGILKKETDNYKDALKDFQKALELYPDNTDILLEMGILSVELNKRDAIKYFNKIIKIDPSSRNYITRINARQKIYGRQDSAKKLAEGKYAEITDNKYIIYNKKHAKEDIKDLNKIIELVPFDLFGRALRAERYTYLKQYNNAIKDYDFLIKIEPPKHIHYSMRALCKEELGLYEEVIQDCNKAIEVHEGTADWSILGTRGIANYKLGNYKKALSDFDTAIDIEIEEDEELFYYRGLTNYKLKHFVKACDDFKKAVAIKSDIESKYAEKIPKLLKIFLKLTM